MLILITQTLRACADRQVWDGKQKSEAGEPCPGLVRFELGFRSQEHTSQVQAYGRASRLAGLKGLPAAKFSIFTANLFMQDLCQLAERLSSTHETLGSI